MKYKAKILELMAAKNKKAFGDWLASHSALEQVAIMKELKQMRLNQMFETQNFENSESLKDFSEITDDFEQMALLEKELKELLKKVEAIRERVRLRLMN